MFATAEEARASEARFREVQAECDAGRVPRLCKGDAVYVDTSLFLTHGVDDFRGGLAEVIEVVTGICPGDQTPYVRFAQETDTKYNWELLAAQQTKLRGEFGKGWSHPDPDYRKEFNEG